MRLLFTLAWALVLQSSLKYAHAAPHNPAAESAHHNWTLHQEALSDRLNESEFAWVVQTGRESAEEAVAAVMVTFLQRASRHAGFVADVESIGKVKLADTSHIIERWSLARWEQQWPQQRLESDPEAETDIHRQQRPSFSHTAHKVLPGFNLMHAKWPAAKWYIMIDDDTFVFRRALAKLLSGLDPQQKHYIGYPRQGASICRDPSASEHLKPSDTPFALAGCGMILSQGAMKRLAQVIVECIIASQDCYLDDVRLFLCLQDIGIHLDTTISYPAMNFAPTKNIDWGRLDPCLHPVVFHGVMPMEMHMLHAADLKHHGQANMADIFAEMATWGIHSDRTGKQAATAAKQETRQVSSDRQQSAGSLKGIQISEIRKSADSLKAAACPDNSRGFAILQLGEEQLHECHGTMVVCLHGHLHMPKHISFD
ncbi:MAG: hypothetical protein FRX49_02559 [Trebouxia sp. A1-2]|nr:MAG: hypothetical protein FRX49_02559 [Trebouxia sp. A1-2]